MIRGGGVDGAWIGHLYPERFASSTKARRACLASVILVLGAAKGISASRGQSYTAAYRAAFFEVGEQRGWMDEDEVSGGDEDYKMRGVGLIHAALPYIC